MRFTLAKFAGLVLGLVLSACAASGHYDGPGGTISFSGEIHLDSGEPADPGAESLGTGEITLEDGSTFTGEFFDTNGDGTPDRFKPDAGQDTGHGATTDGETWYDLDVKARATPDSPAELGKPGGGS